MRCGFVGHRLDAESHPARDQRFGARLVVDLTDSVGDDDRIATGTGADIDPDDEYDDHS